VPAVPSATGVADVFAFQDDGTVQAITSDGATAWTADVSQARQTVPDFQGGLVVVGNNSIWKLDGTTGQPYPAYTLSGTSRFDSVAVHTDGTIFAVQAGNRGGGPSAVVGVDPTTGTQKFSVPVVDSGGGPLSESQRWGDVSQPNGPIIAGDGYAYFAYIYRSSDCVLETLEVLRISSSGAYDNIKILDLPANTCEWDWLHASIITNADTGVLLTWRGTSDDGQTWASGVVTVTGTSASLISVPQVPGQYSLVTPVLQAQDGSFVGTVDTESGSNMVSFDASGNVRWMVPNEQPQIATADGGVIGQSGITYDSNGNATGQVSPLTQTWTGNMYQRTGSLDAMAAPSVFEAGASFWATVGGNPSGNGTAMVQCQCLLQSTNAANPSYIKAALREGQKAFTPQDQRGQTYLMLVSQPGIRWNAGQSFVLAAQTASSALTQSGASSNSVPILVSTVSDFANALTANGLITGGVVPTTTLGMSGPLAGGVTFFGHGGWVPYAGAYYSALALSPTRGSQYNLWLYDVDQLSNANLGSNAAIVLNACDAGANYNGSTSIAQLLANRLRRTVWAYPVGMHYSADPTPGPIKVVGRNADGTPVYETVSNTPLYMVPDKSGVKAIPFYPRPH
jgi:hypothetical protein